ncbi:MAG TPA: YCF48-related protein [Solimonas sp.]|nr:YCF48-related protein [Solimonas sp.]
MTAVIRGLHARRVAIAIAFAALAACGGDGGTAGASDPPPSPFSGLSCSAPAGAGWCWQRPLATAFDVHDLFFLDAQRGWAAGENGTVLRTDDGGGTWLTFSAGRRSRLSQIRFADALNGWALVAQDAQLLRTSDGGRSWAATAAPPILFPETLQLTRSGMLVLSGGTLVGRFRIGLTVLSEDGGNTWRVPAGAGTGDVVTDSGVIWQGAQRSQDGGRTFERHPAFPALRLGGVIGSEGRRVWAVVDVDTAPFHQAVGWSEDDGETWRFWPVETPAGLDTRRVEPAWLYADGTGWGYVRGGLIENEFWGHTNDAGRTWQPLALPAGVDPQALSGGVRIDGKTLWFADTSGAWITRDGGQGFSAFALPPGFVSGPFGSSGSRDSAGAIVLRDSDGRSWRSADDGGHWMPVPGATAGDAAITALSFISATQGMALASDGVLLATADAGLSWARRTRLGSKATGAGHLHVAAGQWWLVDGDARIQRSADGGLTWGAVAVSSAGSEPVVALRFFTASEGVATTLACVEQDIGRVCDLWAHATQDGGKTWQRRASPAGNSVAAMAFGSALRGVRVRNDGSGIVEWSHDGGITWPAASVDAPFGLAATKITWVDENLVWMVNFRGLARSRDGGRTWASVTVQELPERPGQTAQPFLRDLAFADANRGWLVGEDGIVMATTDGGESWQLQPVSTQQALTSVFALDAQRAWIGGSRGTLFGTATGGR